MKKISYLLLILLVMLCIGCGDKKENEAIKSGKVTCDQMKEIMKYDGNPYLIDVRTKEEYDSGHLDGAINIPYEQVVETLGDTYTVHEDTPIVVYCRSGNRSGQAFTALKNAGYKNVYDLGAMESCK
jgi:rhodanese-related sulfurtransferase